MSSSLKVFAIESHDLHLVIPSHDLVWPIDESVLQQQLYTGHINYLEKLGWEKNYLINYWKERGDKSLPTGSKIW